MLLSLLGFSKCLLLSARCNRNYSMFNGVPCLRLAILLNELWCKTRLCLCVQLKWIYIVMRIPTREIVPIARFGSFALFHFHCIKTLHSPVNCDSQMLLFILGYFECTVQTMWKCIQLSLSCARMTSTKLYVKQFYSPFRYISANVNRGLLKRSQLLKCCWFFFRFVIKSNCGWEKGRCVLNFGVDVNVSNLRNVKKTLLFN